MKTRRGAAAAGKAKRRRVEVSPAPKVNRRQRASSTSSWSSSSDSSGSEDNDIEWLSERFPTERSELSYSRVRVLDETVSLGDSLWVEVEGHRELQPILLKEMWEDKNGQKWGFGTWYYYYHKVRIKMNKHKRELFESDNGDEFPLGSIREKIPLFTSSKTFPQNDRTAYLCRYFYDSATKILIPCSSKNRNQPRRVIPDDSEEVAVDNDNDNDNEYDRAFRALQLSAIPDSMPCRDSEHSSIRSFILNGIRKGGSQLALYISGMPGTGKTATVNEVIRSLNEESRQGEIPRFSYTELNGLKLPNPEEAYSVLAHLILDSSTKMSPTRACQELESYFSTPDPRRDVRVLIVDEIDQLVTKKQQLLYNIFDWPQRKHARLVVVGIANTMDLPERLLPRIQSRLGEGRIMFAPYKREQIEAIVQHRLQGISIFDQDAIGFSARKVASLSGDVRRALQLCRRAVEICKRSNSNQSNPQKVTIEHIMLAIKEIDSKLHCQQILYSGIIERLFLICLSKHSRAINCDKVVFQDVFRRFTNSCQILPECKTLIDQTSSSRQLILQMVDKLIRVGLIEKETNTKQRPHGPVISLTFDYEDMRSILQNDPLLSPLL